MDDKFYKQPKSHRLGDQPVEDEYRAKLTAIMSALDDFLNDGKKGEDRTTGLVVLMFPFGDREGRCNFMSNGADRRDVVKLMKEMIGRFEADGV